MIEHRIEIRLVLTSDGGMRLFTPLPGGDAAMPKPAAASWDAVVKEYLEWGREFGGKGGRPWADRHEQVVKSQLDWWKTRLAVERLEVVRLQDIESGLRELKARRYSPATVRHYAIALRALLTWAVKRDLLPKHPMVAANQMPNEPQKRRRAMTAEEIQKLLKAAPADRALLYRVALATAMRKGELRALTVSSLDREHQGVRLTHTKNRDRDWLPLPPALFADLCESAKGKADDDCLLSVPDKAATRMQYDLLKAGVTVRTPEGELDFHALRTTAITLFERAGANHTEVLRFGRHRSEGPSDRYRRSDAESIRAKQVSIWEGINQDNGGGYGARTRDLQTARQSEIVIRIQSENPGQLAGFFQSEGRLSQTDLAPQISPEIQAIAELIGWFVSASPERRKALLELARGSADGRALDKVGLSDGQNVESPPVIAKPSQPVSIPAREPNYIGGAE